jgi:hypothetical protein
MLRLLAQVPRRGLSTTKIQNNNRENDMPLLLEYDEKTIAETQDETRKDGFAPMVLSKEQSDMVLYHKVEAISDKRSDTQHDPNKPWHDGPYVGLPPVVLQALQNNPDFDGKIMVNGVVVGEDHGIILHFHGSPIKTYKGVPVANGYVHVDTRNGMILTPQEASSMAVISNRIPPKYRMWEFRLHRAIWTDGPERRQRLQETAEAQRARAEERMADSVTNAFKAVLGSLGQQPTNINQMQISNPETLANALADAVKAGDILPEQARATFDFAMDEAEAQLAQGTKESKSTKKG